MLFYNRCRLFRGHYFYLWSFFIRIEDPLGAARVIAAPLGSFQTGRCRADGKWGADPVNPAGGASPQGAGGSWVFLLLSDGGRPVTGPEGGTFERIVSLLTAERCVFSFFPPECGRQDGHRCPTPARLLVVFISQSGHARSSRTKPALCPQPGCAGPRRTHLAQTQGARERCRPRSRAPDTAPV